MGERDQYLAVPEPHKSVEIFLCYMSPLLISGSNWNTETWLSPGLTGLLGDCNSVYQAALWDRCIVVVSFCLHQIFLGGCPVSWQGYRWWTASLWYRSIPPPGHMLLFLPSNSTSHFLPSMKVFIALLILPSIINIFSFLCPPHSIFIVSPSVRCIIFWNTFQAAFYFYWK